jgi:hypothetical protein
VNAFGTSALEVSGGNAYFIGYDGYFYKYNSTSKVVEKTFIDDSPYDIVIDNSRNEAVILCTGNYAPKTGGKLIWVDLTTLAKKDSIMSTPTDSIDYTAKIVPAGSKSYLMFGGKVRVVDLASRTVTNNAFISGFYYGGYFDSERNKLYLGTAQDFQNDDVVDVYDAASGTKETSLNVGIAPAHFAKAK